MLWKYVLQRVIMAYRLAVDFSYLRCPIFGREDLKFIFASAIVYIAYLEEKLERIIMAKGLYSIFRFMFEMLCIVIAGYWGLSNVRYGNWRFILCVLAPLVDYYCVECLGRSFLSKSLTRCI